ncbi:MULTISPECIES: RbsD/FucU family protein [Bacillus]|uniref:RbsD/FucU family protein n=1 Tax=Bacillus TaxID=1386 RepID=UPI0002DC0F1E|nr:MULTISPECIES: RbsD/FucU domain-containing protein [Bacillus]
MLKNIPSIISPELMKILMEMGHGDEIVLADGNFPAASMAKRLVRYDGQGTIHLLEAIADFFPIDTYVSHPATVMKVVEGDSINPTIWGQYDIILSQAENRIIKLEHLERNDFYERAKNAHAIVATSEKALYANIILKKGIITEDR